MGLPLLWSFCPQKQASGLRAPATIFIFELSLESWAVFNLFIGDIIVLISQSDGLNLAVLTSLGGGSHHVHCSWFINTRYTKSDSLTHQPQCVCQPCEISQLCWSRVGRGHNIQRPSNIIRSNLFSVFELKKRQCIRVIRVNNHTGGMM